MQTEDTDKQDQEIQALLKDYPMPQATATFYDRALARATHEGTRRQRKRWVMAGFASAVAAGLAFWLIGGFFLATPILPDADPGIPGITMTLEEPRTVNLTSRWHRACRFSGAARDHLANQPEQRKKFTAA
jgi:hypothetical protein